MSQLSLALFGVGRWGTHLLRNFLAHPQVQVLAVVDLDESQLLAKAQQFNLDSTVELLTDWAAALALPGLQAVAIATPAATHNALVTAALHQNLHVLVEKPLTLDTQSSTKLCQLAEQQQRQLVVDHTYLFHPIVEAGQRTLEQIGHRRYGYASRTNLGPVRHDVDALWDLAIHDIAIFNHWLQEIPCQVQAHGLGWQQPEVNHPPLFPQGLADVVWCRLKYPSGFEATLHLCWANPDKQRKLCIVGDQGTLIFDEMNATHPLTLQQGSFSRVDGRFVPQGLKTVPIEVQKDEPLGKLCDHFVTCALNNHPTPISSGWLGTDLVKVLEALSKSLQRGGPWLTLE